MAIDIPRVSVVIPALNMEAYLGECLESVFTQTYSRYEVIVVDDGSTDQTAEVALQYGPRVRLIRQAHRGTAAARNAGVRAARGDLVAFLDADDVWLPAYLEKQVATFDANGGNCVVFCDVYWWDGRTPRTGVKLERRIPFDTSDPLLSIVRGSDLPVDGVLVPRELLLEAGLSNEQLREGTEVDLFQRLASLNVRFCHTPMALALYRHRPGSVSTRRPRESTENYLRELWGLGRDERLPVRVRRAAIVRARSLRHRFAWLALQALLQGQFDEARACWLSAYRIRPSNLQYALGALLMVLAPRATLTAVTRLRHVRRAMWRLRPGQSAPYA